MLGYHVAALNGKVKGIAGTTFLDQRIRQVADETAYSRVVSRVGTPLVRLAVRIGLGGLRVPMRMVSKMSALVNDEKALKAFYGDRTSAGRWASQRFLASYVSVRPAIEPEDFDICPVLLVQPAQDRWSPLHLSTPFLDRVKQVPVQVVMLENAGHYPLEEPGLTQLHDAVLRFVRENV
jgi:pimeloyl-ACP methyl ester carboxylesterase